MKNNSAFTLIELLVVVLIIGILAAIALPQYTQAVEKSRAMEAVTILKAINDAEERFFLENNTPPTSTDDLDVSIPSNTTFTYSCFFPRGNCQAKRANTDYSMEFTASFDSVFPGQRNRWCVAANDKGKRICTAIGGKDTGWGAQGGFYYYNL